ncbi:uncharacterized histidine-rich protein DDB_G0274557-like [Belonocnema kinseyi]|uniref:uncharacterized histidine-rich protein DDB_G0274557-like n=1 Tax=Belonocnema kinseyi TaxID=2817044 RepID=UPI00143DF11F|nr:uncharacterized histidine-rich protein DDB_G0274557-like [Belonocnema kinseyi]
MKLIVALVAVIMAAASVEAGHHQEHIQVPAPHPIPAIHPEPLHLKVHDHPNPIHYKAPHVPHPHLIGVETHVPEPEIKHVKHGW